MSPVTRLAASAQTCAADSVPAEAVLKLPSKTKKGNMRFIAVFHLAFGGCNIKVASGLDQPLNCANKLQICTFAVAARLLLDPQGVFEVLKWKRVSLIGAIYFIFTQIAFCFSVSIVFVFLVQKVWKETIKNPSAL